MSRLFQLSTCFFNVNIHVNFALTVQSGKFHIYKMIKNQVTGKKIASSGGKMPLQDFQVP